MASLSIQNQPNQPPRSVALGNETTIGRLGSNTLCIHDSSVSGKHAKIIKQTDGYCLVDLQSRNGISVNGEKVFRRFLKDKDQVAIGKSLCIFSDPPLAQVQDKQESLPSNDMEETSFVEPVKSISVSASKLPKNDSPTKDNASIKSSGTNKRKYIITMGIIAIALIISGLYFTGVFSSKSIPAPIPELNSVKVENAEEVNKAEELRKVEEARIADEVRKAEEIKKVEEIRKAAELKIAEEAKRADEARKAEEIKKAEEAKRAEEIRKAEEIKKAEESRRAEAVKKAWGKEIEEVLKEDDLEYLKALTKDFDQSVADTFYKFKEEGRENEYYANELINPIYYSTGRPKHSDYFKKQYKDFGKSNIPEVAYDAIVTGEELNRRYNDCIRRIQNFQKKGIISIMNEVNFVFVIQLGGYSKVWAEAIERNSQFPLYFMDFSTVLSIQLIEYTRLGVFLRITIIKEQIKNFIKDLPKDKYSKTLELYSIFSQFYSLVDSPTGNLSSFNAKIDNLKSEFEKVKSLAELEY